MAGNSGWAISLGVESLPVQFTGDNSGDSRNGDFNVHYILSRKDGAGLRLPLG
jgi:hypothetical protein